MSNALSMRLKRLERNSTLADPYAHLTDEQLASRIAEIDRTLELFTGMSAHTYTLMLEGIIDRREPLPDDISPEDARAFTTTMRNFGEGDARVR